MNPTAEVMQDYAANLAELAQATEERARLFHVDDRDKFNDLMGYAKGLRHASEGITEILTRPAERTLRPVS